MKSLISTETAKSVTVEPEVEIDYINDEMLKSTVSKVESDKLAFSVLFSKIPLPSISPELEVAKEEIISLLVKLYKMPNETAETFAQKLSKKGKFSLLKLVSFLQSQSELSFVDIEKVILKIKSTIKQNEVTNYNHFLQTNNIKSDKPLSAKEFGSLFSSVFRLSFYEAVATFSEVVYIDQNPLKASNQLSADIFFSEFKIDRMFKKEVPKLKIDPNMKLALEKLKTYFNSQKDKMEVFKKIDTNKNGSLNSEEFFEFLTSIKEIKIDNGQKAQIVNFADINGDNNINYREFLDFIENINKENNLVVEDESVTCDLGINFTDLKNNFEFNKANRTLFKANQFFLVLFELQYTYFKKFYEFDSIEKAFFKEDPQLTFKVPTSTLIKIVKAVCKSTVDAEVEKQLSSYALENAKCNYKTFFIKLSEFKCVNNVKNSERTPTVKNNAQPQVKEAVKPSKPEVSSLVPKKSSLAFGMKNALKGNNVNLAKSLLKNLEIKVQVDNDAQILEAEKKIMSAFAKQKTSSLGDTQQGLSEEKKQYQFTWS